MTADSRYFRLKAVGLSRKHEDDFTSACFETGAAGVAEDLKFVQADLRYDPDIIETPVLDLNVYFESAPDEGRLLSLQAAFSEVRFELVSEENRDWLLEWKKGFKPFLFSSPFWVIPSWLKAPPEAPTDPRHLIFVEPGMAFGTGTHETTRLAAAFVIEECMTRKPNSLLDVGTGTAILALLASRLGVAKVVGIDNDPEASRTARENLERNGDRLIQIPELDLKNVTETYDVVVANIIDGVLTLLREDLFRVLKPGGHMILSGVLNDREAEFYEHFSNGFGADRKLNLLKKTKDGEWSAALLEKKN
jgi:ribosomal protein L11 methyltransferase